MKKILMIDDEPGMRDLLKILLESKDYSVVTAVDGIDGLVCFSKEDFDLVILDTHMPGLNGYETFKKMREKKKDQLIISFSSSSDPSFVLENKMLKEGVFACLYKPLEIEDILKKVEEAFNSEK